MKSSSLLVAGLLSLTLVALTNCDKGGNGFNKANVASGEITQMDNLDKAFDKDGIVIDQSGKNTGTEKNVDENLTREQLQTLHAQLALYIQLGDDVSDKMSTTKSPYRETILTRTQIRVSEASAWMDQVEKRMAGQTSKQPAKK